MVIEPAEGFEVLGPSIDQITHTPEPIFIGIEPHLLKQVLKGLKTPLDIANDLGTHLGSAQLDALRGVHLISHAG